MILRRLSLEQSAYTLLSDPRKRQLYDQFGDQGVQMVDTLKQAGLPEWLLLPAAQRTVLALLLTGLVLFAVLLPLFILMRADEEDGWPWVITLVPVWLADALYGAALAWRLHMAVKASADASGSSGSPILALRPALLAVASFACVVGTQVLLTMRLSSPDSPVTYTLALVPLYAAMLPDVIGALITLAAALYRRVKPRRTEEGAEVQAPTCAQLSPALLSLAGYLLFAGTLCLSALNGDGLLDISWWLVLAPAWLHAALLWTRWFFAIRAAVSGQPPPANEEERAAKIGALALAAIVGTLLTVCLLLLSLRLGGQASYPAPFIAAPLFGVLALLACCCSCIACVANAANRAQQNHANGPPPYQEVNDEEAPPPPSCGGGGGNVSSASPVPAPSPDPSVREGSDMTAESASRIAAAVDLGQQLAAELSPRSEGAPGASPTAAANAAMAQRLRQLEGLSSKEIKAELTALGVAHEHCLEKRELLALLMAQ